MDYKEPRYHPAVVEFEKMVADRERYKKTVEEWLRYSWRWAQTDKYKLVFKVQAAIVKAIREYLDGRGFVEVLPPIVGPVTDPGIRGAKQASIDFYGHEYKVMSSAILYKQYMAASLGKIYFVSPNLRLEPPDSLYTGRHLVEFFQVDIEMYGADYGQAMEVAEGLVTHVVKRVREEYGRQLEDVLGRSLPEFKPPFKRYPHSEAIKIVNSYGCRNDPRSELTWECEKLMSGLHAQPFFVYDYPRGSRGFYDREDPQRPGVLRDFDMLYPEGFGEAISGAEREYEPERVMARIREGGEDPRKYEWFLQMLKELYPLKTAGFGIGVERLTRYICGLRALWEARPYPKVAGIAPTP
ncbi:asparagine synthetase A [Pyrobaculum neutrophilum]|uniref:tRNA synthetase class II (D K and N) n=1 Tax=Pyrobaculum neutrophilum (strain DSM 2338 / JCM 9278 / NBRC 100436 / V24Sta) TaxID=444157 RepID=B1YDI7_PYRNV|nr:asparagine synthetase A [Pyrobaculum neutrophilum]ACB39850.1 tRNA synthetase class II (D K and N) [Pyrobaculum neutrophilum V24Sta]